MKNTMDRLNEALADLETQTDAGWAVVPTALLDRVMKTLDGAISDVRDLSAKLQRQEQINAFAAVDWNRAVDELRALLLGDETSLHEEPGIGKYRLVPFSEIKRFVKKVRKVQAREAPRPSVIDFAYLIEERLVARDDALGRHRSNLALYHALAKSVNAVGNALFFGRGDVQESVADVAAVAQIISDAMTPRDDHGQR